MFARLLFRSLQRRRRRKVAALASVALGTGAASALLAAFLSVGDRVAEELRRYEANLLVLPAGAGLVRGATLAEADLPGIKGHFWRNNVVGLAPFLDVETEAAGRKVTLVGTWFARAIGAGENRFLAGVESIGAGWEVEGSWFETSGGALLGASLARDLGLKSGDRLSVAGRDLRVSGILSTGGDEERQVFVDLGLAQEIAEKPGRVSRVLVSARTTPEAELAGQLGGPGDTIASLARRMRTDPSRLPPEIVERFSCTPYATSIALAIDKAVPSAVARPIRQATETEGAVLGRVRGALLFLAAFAAASAVLGVLAAATAEVIERRAEIGLWRALGGSGGKIAALFLAEAAAIGLAGGAAGLGIGVAASGAIGAAVFGASLPVPPALAVLSLLGAMAASLLGAALPLAEAVRLHPRTALRPA